jgi:hypothetical protein
MRLLSGADRVSRGRESRLQTAPEQLPRFQNSGVRACSALRTGLAGVLLQMDGVCRAVYGTLALNGLHLLGLDLLVPRLSPALQAVPVGKLSCGLDSLQFPPRGSRADVFRSPEVLLTFPSLPADPVHPLVRSEVSWSAWASRLRRWFRR